MTQPTDKPNKVYLDVSEPTRAVLLQVMRGLHNEPMWKTLYNLVGTPDGRPPNGFQTLDRAQHSLPFLLKTLVKSLPENYQTTTGETQQELFKKYENASMHNAMIEKIRELELAPKVIEDMLVELEAVCRKNKIDPYNTPSHIKTFRSRNPDHRIFFELSNETQDLLLSAMPLLEVRTPMYHTLWNLVGLPSKQPDTKPLPVRGFLREKQVADELPYVLNTLLDSLNHDHTFKDGRTWEQQHEKYKLFGLNHAFKMALTRINPDDNQLEGAIIELERLCESKNINIYQPGIQKIELHFNDNTKNLLQKLAEKLSTEDYPVPRLVVRLNKDQVFRKYSDNIAMRSLLMSFASFLPHEEEFALNGSSVMQVREPYFRLEAKTNPAVMRTLKEINPALQDVAAAIVDIESALTKAGVNITVSSSSGRGDGRGGSRG